MIENKFNDIKEKTGFIIFPPADIQSIEETNRCLLSSNLSDIPLEYKILLKLSNGFIYNGVELMGTQPHYRKEKNYTFPSLTDINNFTTKYDFFFNKIILGRVSESIILYDKEINSYAVADRVNLRSRIESKELAEICNIFL